MPDEERDNEESMIAGDAESRQEEEEDSGVTEEPEGVTEAPESVVIPSPAPIVLPSAVPILGKTGDAIWGEQKPKPKNDMADLFEVPQETDNDMYTADLFEVDDQTVDMEDDLSDLTRVTKEDIMGSPPKPKLRPQFRRTKRPYSPPSSLGGLR